MFGWYLFGVCLVDVVVGGGDFCGVECDGDWGYWFCGVGGFVCCVGFCGGLVFVGYFDGGVFWWVVCGYCGYDWLDGDCFCVVFGGFCGCVDWCFVFCLVVLVFLLICVELFERFYFWGKWGYLGDLNEGYFVRKDFSVVLILLVWV